MRGKLSRLGALVVLGVCAHAAAQPAYRFVEIEPPAPYVHSWATAVNDLDQVVGGMQNPGEVPQRFPAFLWDRGVLTELPLFSFWLDIQAATGINSRGQVAGNSMIFPMPGSYFPMASRYDVHSGSMEHLSTMTGGNGIPYSSTYAGRINARGDVAIIGPRPNVQGGFQDFCNGAWPVGTSTNPVWADGDSVPSSVAPGGINSRGDLVGDIVHILPDGTSQCYHGGYSSAGGPMVDIGDLSITGAYSRLSDINDSGLAVGWSEGGLTPRRAITFSGGVLTDLGEGLGSGGTTFLAEATAVNDAGVIVGHTILGHETATAWFGGVAVNLEDYMPTGTDWFYLNRAVDINRRGVIVGYGSKIVGGNLITRGFALVPADVYVMSSGDAAIDTAVTNALEANGLTPVVGVPYTDFDGSQNISSYHAVYMQANANESAGDMPFGGQITLADYVTNGGGLVTSEAVLCKAAQGELTGLLGVFPAAASGTRFSFPSPRTYSVRVPNKQLNEGLPGSFDFPVDNFGWTESELLPVSGSLIFYESDGVRRGVMGRTVGAGRSLSISVGAGTGALADPEFARLLANAMRWASGPDEAGCSPAPLERILAPAPQANAFFGASMASDGVRFAVTRWNSSALLVYAKNGAGAWAVEAELSVPGWSFSDNAVAVRGDRIAAVADQPLGGGEYLHRVYVFNRSVAGVWSQSAVIDPGPPDDVHFGRSIALSHNLIAVGGPYVPGQDGQGNPIEAAGKVWTYFYCGNQWCVDATLTTPNPIAFGRFGGSVAIMTDNSQESQVVLVMAPAESPDGVRKSGRLYAIRRVTIGSYYIEQQLLPANPQDHVGFDIPISTFGNRVAVGWHVDEDPAANRYSGALEVWRRDGFVSLWSREAYLWHADHCTEPWPPSLGDALGARIFLGDGVLAAVAPFLEGPVYGDQGAIVLFRLGSAGWTEDVTLREPDAVPNILGGPLYNGWWLGDLAIVEDEVLMATHSYDAPGIDNCGAIARFRISMNDCNGNGVSDECDIASGTSLDADGDGIPDECRCVGDYNRDGFVDSLDYNQYINDFESGSMAADVNGDGFLDPLDYNGFINAFEAGC